MVKMSLVAAAAIYNIPVKIKSEFKLLKAKTPGKSGIVKKD